MLLHVWKCALALGWSVCAPHTVGSCRDDGDAAAADAGDAGDAGWQWLWCGVVDCCSTAMMMMMLVCCVVSCCAR